MNVQERMIEKMGGPESVRAALIDLIVATNLDPVPPTMAMLLDECDQLTGSSASNAG